MDFIKAELVKSKLRLCLTGPSGSGKTYSALRIARGLVGKEGRIAVIDSENASAAKYAADFEFDVLVMADNHHPDRYVEALHAAEEAGYDVVIMDSLTPPWQGPGGLLEIVEQIMVRKRYSSTIQAWKDANPIERRLWRSINESSVHVIATMRTRTQWVIEEIEDKTGRRRSVPKKVGTEAVQRQQFEYEFDVLMDMDLEHRAVVEKTRYTKLVDAVIEKPDEKLGKVLAGWLDKGVEPPPRQISPQEFAESINEGKPEQTAVDAEAIEHGQQPPELPPEPPPAAPPKAAPVAKKVEFIDALIAVRKRGLAAAISLMNGDDSRGVMFWIEHWEDVCDKAQVPRNNNGQYQWDKLTNRTAQKALYLEALRKVEELEQQASDSVAEAPPEPADNDNEEQLKLD